MSCVEGWWNYNDQTPEYLDEIWIYYDDAEDCSLEGVVLDNCGGSRGILAYRDSGAGGYVIPCTNNPFYQADILGFFQIRADINVLDMDSDFFNVEVFAVDEPYISNGGSPVLVGVGSLPDNFNVCQEIVIQINTVAAVEALKVSPYIFFRVGSGGV